MKSANVPYRGVQGTDSMKPIISGYGHWPLTPSPALLGGGWGGGAASAGLVACAAAISDRWIFARSFPHPSPPPQERERERGIASFDMIRTSETLVQGRFARAALECSGK
jgi:hypothetical protein